MMTQKIHTDALPAWFQPARHQQSPLAEDQLQRQRNCNCRHNPAASPLSNRSELYLATMMASDTQTRLDRGASAQTQPAKATQQALNQIRTVQRRRMSLLA
eukprot:TRINITY_DN1463_c0_g1_i18.p1 TRINITY_DN1463_c0_g1~~TRINITY_DN1463_c0_g1_i18.p1  ORF type:complete len:101 (+),score=14.83 TRINITY_DN1463_c0_g1_i18:380-682(+)